MKIQITLVILGLFALSPGSAQPVNGQIFGGGQNEQGICFDMTHDDGYILVGNTRSFGSGSNDIYLVKVNPYGLKEWDFPYGILYQDFGLWVEQTSDLGFIVTGYKWGQGYGGEDVVLLKTDAAGNQQWKKYIGHPARDQGFCVKELSDGYIITGHTMSYDIKGDVYVVRTDLDGNVIWDKNLGTDTIDYSYSITPAPGGDFIIAGTRGGFYNVDLTVFLIPDADAMLIRINGEGDVIWQKYYGGAGHDWFWSIVPDQSGEGYYALGSTQSYGQGSFDLYLVKINQEGDEEWHTTFGGGRYDYGKSIVVAPSGDLYLLGSSKSYGQNGSSDLYLVKTDPLGNKLWDLTLGGDFSDFGHCVRATREGGCVVLGEYQWEDETRDMYLVGIDSLGHIVSLGNTGDWLAESNYLNIFPNPFSQNATLLLKDSSALQGYELEIVNQAGQLVRQEIIEGAPPYLLRRNQLPSGMYFLRIRFLDDPSKILTGKFIIY